MIITSLLPYKLDLSSNQIDYLEGRQPFSKIILPYQSIYIPIEMRGLISVQNAIDKEWVQIEQEELINIPDVPAMTSAEIYELSEEEIPGTVLYDIDLLSLVIVLGPFNIESI